MTRQIDIDVPAPTAPGIAPVTATIDAAASGRFKEGAAAYWTATPIGPCIGASASPYIDSAGGTAMRRAGAFNGYAECYANVDRLVGYIEAMAAEVRELRRLVRGF